ncbi:MAG: hypothetical protein IT458_12235 [Planctomycetes bacterium]|nr:hypothetical protein [Planctomycetota bacterium]
MQLDDLKDAWAAHGAALARSLVIDERQLRETMLRKVRRGFVPYILCRALEVALGAAALFLVVPVLLAHAAEPRYLAAGGAVAAYASVVAVFSAVLLVRALRLDHAAPVAALQCDVERLRLDEYRALKWAVLGGVVVWLPLPLLLIEACGGGDVLARVDGPWLVANLLAGGALLVGGLAWSRRYVERADLAPWARRLVHAVSGRGSRTAAERLAELARFMRE